MEFYMKMPRNKREFVLFLFIVSVISVNILAPVISGSSTGFDLSVWHYTDVLVALAADMADRRRRRPRDV